MPHHTTLVQRCRATNSLLANELEMEFSRLENDRSAAADEIEQLKADAAAMAECVQAGDRSRDEVIEECAAWHDKEAKLKTGDSFYEAVHAVSAHELRKLKTPTN